MYNLRTRMFFVYSIILLGLILSTKSIVYSANTNFNSKATLETVLTLDNPVVLTFGTIMVDYTEQKGIIELRTNNTIISRGNHSPVEGHNVGVIKITGTPNTKVFIDINNEGTVSNKNSVINVRYIYNTNTKTLLSVAGSSVFNVGASILLNGESVISGEYTGIYTIGIHY